MDELKLCESDYRFMSIIWDNEPLSSHALVDQCAQKLGWKKSTTYKALEQRFMCCKGKTKGKTTLKRVQENPVAIAATGFILGTPEGTRTPNIQNRNLTLYPLNYGRKRALLNAM